MTVKQRRWFTAAILTAMIFLSFINSLNGSLLNDMIDEYELKDAAQGFMNTATSIGSTLAMLSSLFLMGRMAKKKMLMISIAACICATVFLRFCTPTYALFLLFSMVMGMCTGYLDPLLSSNMADTYEGKQANRMMGVLHTTFSASSVLVPVIFMSLLNQMEAQGKTWKNVYLFTAFIGVIAFVVYVFCLPRGKVADQKQVAVKEAGNARVTPQLIKEKMRDGILPGLFIAMILHNIFFCGIAAWINRYIGVTLGSDIGDIALSFLWFGIMISRLCVPMLPIKVEKYICTAGFLTGGVVLVGVLLKNPVCMCVATLLAGLLFGAMLTCMLNVGCEACRENTLLATTSLGIAMSIGAMIASPAIGMLESVFDLHIGMAANAVMIILSSIVLILTPGIRKGTGKQASEKK